MAKHAYSTPARGRAPLTTRAQLEAAVEAAIAALDALDGDPDLEEQCEDEGAQVDAEQDDADKEPALGWPEARSQAQGVSPGDPRLHGEGGLFEFGGATYDEEFN